MTRLIRHRRLSLVPVAVALALAAPAGSRAQGAADPLQTDRPDFTEGVATVTPGRFQLEGGYTFTRAGPDREHTIGELLVRLGVAPRLEARIGVNSYAVVDAPGGVVEGLEDVSVGAKVRLVQPGSGAPGGAPELSALASLTLPTGAEGIGADEAQPAVLLAASWALSERLALGTNLGYENVAESGERVDQGFGSAALGVGLTGSLGAFLEWFAVFPEGAEREALHFLDAGLTLGVGPDAQLDARAGVGLDAAGPSHFAGVGVAWRR